MKLSKNISYLAAGLLGVALLTGCQDTTRDLWKLGYHDLCEREGNNSVMCYDQPVTGSYISKYDITVNAYNMNQNKHYIKDIDQYGVKEYWAHNDSIYEYLAGDCEDIAMTFAAQLIHDGYSADSIYLVVSGIDGVVNHTHARVILDDGEVYDYNAIPSNTDIAYMRLDRTKMFIYF